LGLTSVLFGEGFSNKMYEFINPIRSTLPTQTHYPWFDCKSNLIIKINSSNVPCHNTFAKRYHFLLLGLHSSEISWRHPRHHVSLPQCCLCAYCECRDSPRLHVSSSSYRYKCFPVLSSPIIGKLWVYIECTRDPALCPTDLSYALFIQLGWNALCVCVHSFASSFVIGITGTTWSIFLKIVMNSMPLEVI
jgi:hypothetical protein